MTESWRDNLPEELQANVALAQFDSLEAMAKGYVDAKSHLGRSITVPGEDATDDARERFYSKLKTAAPNLTIHPDHIDDDVSAAEFWKLAGVPEDASGYKIEDGFQGLPQEFVDNLREVGKAAGWTKKQFKSTIDEYAREYTEQAQAQEDLVAADRSIVTKKFGNAEEDVKASVHALIKQFEDPDHKLGDLNAAAYLMMNNIVKAFTGKGPQVFEQPIGGDGLTPDEIEEKLAEVDEALIQAGYGDQHKRLMRKKVRLLEMRV